MREMADTRPAMSNIRILMEWPASKTHNIMGEFLEEFLLAISIFHSISSNI
jgi:hypothetical protein